MLRSIAGDPTLSAALRAYDPNADVSLGYGQPTGPGSFQKLLEQAGTRRDLNWFFADWVDADKGLPDLSIKSVFPTPEEAGNFLVTVNIANAGYASAEVPVTVRSDTNTVTQRVFIPARGQASPRIAHPRQAHRRSSTTAPSPKPRPPSTSPNSPARAAALARSHNSPQE